MDQALIDAARQIAMRKEWRLQLTIPSMLATGETFPLHITLFDALDLPTGALEMEIVFVDSIGVEGLPASVRIDASNRGMLTIPDLTATGPEAAQVKAKIDCTGVTFGAASNLAWVSDNPPYRVFWGDLHIHTTFGNCQVNGVKPPEFALQYARDASHLDFMAITDHSHGIEGGDEGQGWRWQRTQELVQAYDAPGTFVPFLAFESSHSREFGGDNNVYFLDTEAPHFWPDKSRFTGGRPNVPLEELWEWLENTGKTYFTASHHTGRRVKFREWTVDRYNPAREPIIEIYSAWGSSESNPSRHSVSGGVNDAPSYYTDALKMGYRFGVIASSDDHSSMPGGMALNGGEVFSSTSLANYPHKGLCGIRATELTRQSLWDAIFRKDCFGTTWRRSLLEIEIGDLHMGQAAEVDGSDPLRKRREIKLTFDGSIGGDMWITVMRNGEVWQQDLLWWDKPRKLVETRTFVDEEPLDAIAIREAKMHPEPFVVYYARLENTGRETVWTSPIWLDLA